MEVNLIRFQRKYVLIIFIILFLMLVVPLASGQELIPFLRGKWAGTVLYQATSTGFTSSKDSISINISEQSILEFKGNAESKSSEKKVSWVFDGYLGKRGRNICLINQDNKRMLIGYIITDKINENLIKLYSWDDENNRAIVYLLRKIESAAN